MSASETLAVLEQQIEQYHPEERALVRGMVEKLERVLVGENQMQAELAVCIVGLKIAQRRGQ